jgi:hypothetical protein
MGVLIIAITQKRQEAGDDQKKAWVARGPHTPN